MRTSSKYRRLIRQRKLRKQRSVAFLVFMMVIVIATVAFSSNSNDENSVVPVVVQRGDTIWSIAKEYKPDGVDINRFVYEISANNGIKDGNIYCGQTIYVPVES